MILNLKCNTIHVFDLKDSSLDIETPKFVLRITLQDWHLKSSVFLVSHIRLTFVHRQMSLVDVFLREILWSFSKTSQMMKNGNNVHKSLTVVNGLCEWFILWNGQNLRELLSEQCEMASQNDPQETEEVRCNVFRMLCQR